MTGKGIAAMERQPARASTHENISAAPAVSLGFAHSSASDAVQLSQQTGDWNFEVSQLAKGPFNAECGALALDSVNLLHIEISRTVLQRGYGPRNMAAIFIPRPASPPVFANGQLVEAGQCMTVMGGVLEGVSHSGYVELDLAFDLNACQSQLEELNGGSMGVQPGTTIAGPGPDWIADMSGRIDWLLKAAQEYGPALDNPRLRNNLTDHLLTAMVHFDASTADLDSTTTRATAARRVAVRLAREYIHAHLSESLPLSELCRHSGLKVRTLETGFREITGLTPIAYIRSLRLNTVRRALHDAAANPRSISEIAMDNGFWHFGQFSLDYRKLFGETPTSTRRRGRASDIS